MTYGEIQLHIDAYNKRVKDEAKENLAQQYNLAKMISTFTVGLLNGDSVPTFEELYPSSDSNVCEGISKQDYNRAMIYKEQFMDFAIRHNKQRKES